MYERLPPLLRARRVSVKLRLTLVLDLALQVVEGAEEIQMSLEFAGIEDGVCGHMVHNMVGDGRGRVTVRPQLRRLGSLAPRNALRLK